MKPAILAALLVVIFAFSSRWALQASAQTPTASDMCSLFSSTFTTRVPQAGASFPAPDGTKATGCEARICKENVCGVRVFLIKSAQAESMFKTQSNGGQKVTGVGTDSAFFGGGAPTLYFYRSGYFYAAFGGRDDEAVLRSTAQQIDGAIQRLSAPVAPAATATTVPPQAAAPTAAAAAPTTAPATSSQGVKTDVDPEKALNDALRNNPLQVLGDLVDGKSFDDASRVAGKAEDAWVAAFSSDGSALEDGVKFFTKLAALRTLTRKDAPSKPLLPSLQSMNLIKVMTLLAIRGRTDPDATVTGNRLLSLLIRQDLAAQGLKPQ